MDDKSISSVVLVTMTTLVNEETSLAMVALVSALVVIDMSAVGMTIMDLLMMEAIFVSGGNYDFDSYDKSLQSLDQ